MFKTIQSLRPLAAPATAVLLIGALFILEERHFDQKSALLVALVTGVAVAEILPAAALGLVFAALVLQNLRIFPLVLLSGGLSYAVVPVVVFFAVIGWKTRNRWVLPVASVMFAGITTVNWFTDQTWINVIFASPIYGQGLLRTLTYAFLIFGAFAALNLAAWTVGVAVNNASRSRRAQFAAETRLRETATELAVEQERNRIARELHDVLAHSLTVIVAGLMRAVDSPLSPWKAGRRPMGTGAGKRSRCRADRRPVGEVPADAYGAGPAGARWGSWLRAALTTE